MAKQIVHISPFFEPRIWGGTRLRNEFGYQTDIDPIGEVYNVVALEGHADCGVPALNTTLANLYREKPDWFDCTTRELPIRVNILDPIADLSVQLHPDDDYALQHSHSRGKPEAWVILDASADGYIEFGHTASTREEFAELAYKKDWKKLLRYLPAKTDWYLDIPAGTLHAIGKNVLTYNISRNADCTYRLYDYDRIVPATGKKRELHVQEVIDNVLVPDNANAFVWFDSREKDGCAITEYWDEPGLYTLKRLKVNGQGRFVHERFAFLTVYEGEGRINDTPIKKGETVLAPQGIGPYQFTGTLDLFLASYRNA